MPKSTNSRPIAQFPTYYKLVRFIANGLDTKNSFKKLDDKVNDKFINPTELQEVINTCIVEPLQNYISLDFAELVSLQINEFLKQYNVILRNNTLNNIDQSQLMHGLVKALFTTQMFELLVKVQNISLLPDLASLLSKEQSSIKTALNWIKNSQPDWVKFTEGLNKEQKDRISAWERGEDLPSVQKIYQIQTYSNNPLPEQIDWQTVRIVLVIARFHDFFEKNYSELCHLFQDDFKNLCKGSTKQLHLNDYILAVEGKLNLTPEQIALLDSINIMHFMLCEKTFYLNSEKLEYALDIHRKAISELKINIIGMHWIEWSTARYHVKNGDLDQANLFYQKAFDHAILTSGTAIGDMYSEALVVASCKHNPDQVFLKKLKWTALHLQFETTTTLIDSPTNKFDDNIGQWEVDRYKANFNNIFPKSYFFEGKAIEFSNEKYSTPLFIVEELLIDVNKPNKKIKYGESWSKKAPQLVACANLENFKEFKNLIEHNANVNSFSDSNESAIGLALESLNKLEFPRSLDKRFYDLLKDIPHNKKTLNTPTYKRRLLPIVSAIESGDIDILKKVIEMGADVNIKSKIENFTPLYVCLFHIANIKNPPDTSWPSQLSNAQIDSITRYDPSIKGTSSEQIKNSIETRKKETLFKDSYELIANIYSEKIKTGIDIEILRVMAMLLIDKGADINAHHTINGLFKIQNYTPLMFAAELNEAELFKYMKDNGGDLTKYYLAEQLGGKKIYLNDIADFFKAKDVLEVLN